MFYVICYTFITYIYRPAITITAIPIATVLPTTVRAGKKPFPPPKRRAFKKIMKNSFISDQVHVASFVFFMFNNVCVSLFIFAPCQDLFQCGRNEFHASITWDIRDPWYNTFS